MRPSTTLPLVLLLSLTTPSLCAPIPVPVEECSHYASCRFYRQRPSTQSKDPSLLQEPHSPTHQLEASKHADTVEVRLLEHHLTPPTLPIQPETPIKNPKLNAIIKAAHKDKMSAEQKLHELGHKSATAANRVISKSHSQSSKSPKGKKYGFTASMIKKVQSVAATRVHKCGMMSGTAEAKDKHRDGEMTITYTYGYSYVPTDYTSVLVVSIVVIFMLLIIVVELLDRVVETSRTLLGLDQGAIRLEDCDCERGHACPPFTHTPKGFRLMPAPPPRRLARSPPRETQVAVLEEKSQGLEAEVPLTPPRI